MRYYGCKTKLLDYIENTVNSLNLKSGAIFFDVFSGTSAVGKHFKKLGFTVYANDFLEFAYAIACCNIRLNEEPKFKKLQNKINIKSATDVLNYLNEIDTKADFITKNYSPFNGNERKYLSIENAKKTDTVRRLINDWKISGLINDDEYYYLLTSLLESINLVSNVTGTYAAFLKTWDNRALKKMILKAPIIIPSKHVNKAFKCDANIVVTKVKSDVLYLDPPYNSRQFAANYFFLELIAEGWFNKKPKIYGQSGMRPYEHQKSRYSMKNEACKALENLVQNAKTKYIILSYNDEGIIPLESIKKILLKRGEIEIFSKDHKRYRAINQDGTKIKTNEVLFLLKINK